MDQREEKAEDADNKSYLKRVCIGIEWVTDVRRIQHSKERRKLILRETLLRLN